MALIWIPQKSTPTPSTSVNLFSHMKSKSSNSFGKDKFRWSHSSSFILSLILMIITLVIIVWWPLVNDYIQFFSPAYPFWMQVDWLLIGIFLVMSVLITVGADIRKDALIIVVSFAGGFLIESWGTHTGLWSYYTGEKPPLWIIPAWPIATLAIERLERIFGTITVKISDPWIRWLYWLIFPGFLIYMLIFVYPTLGMLFTVSATIGVVLVIIFACDHRYALTIFIAGAVLGIFLEYWGTTRECWTYYTLQKPPLFAILAHGLASVAFWRVTKLIEPIFNMIVQPIISLVQSRISVQDIREE
jgi:hypothetical protein